MRSFPGAWIRLRPSQSGMTAILAQAAVATGGSIIPTTYGEMDAGSQTWNPWYGIAQPVLAIVQQIMRITLTSMGSAEYASNEFEAAVVEPHACQLPGTMPPVRFALELHRSKELRKRLRTILAMITLMTSSDQTRNR